MARVPFDPATDYYQLLGLTPAATVGEIQAAYRRMAKAYHPDLHAGSSVAQARMARVNVAKSVLLDRDTRATYDRLRAMRRPVARVAVAHAPATHVVRPSYRTPHSTLGRMQRSGAMDRTTGVLVLFLLPLLGALLLYVFQAVQLVGQPVRAVSSDLALSPGGRPNPRSTADIVWLMVHESGPSPTVARQVGFLIGSRRDQSPEGELLASVARHLQQAAAANDVEGWRAAVAEACALAAHC